MHTDEALLSWIHWASPTSQEPSLSHCSRYYLISTVNVTFVVAPDSEAGGRAEHAGSLRGRGRGEESRWRRPGDRGGEVGGGDRGRR